MTKCTKRLVACLLSLALCSGAATFAADFPSHFWPINDKYAAAVEQKDNATIISAGKEAVAIVEAMPQDAQTMEFLGSRYDQMGLAYERLGDYISAGQCYEKYLPYGRQMGWADGVKIAEAKVLQYTPSISLYIPGQTTQSFYGAKNEQERGVLFGATADGGIRSELENESAILVYLEYGDTYFDYIERILEEAQQKGKAVELALNVPGQGSQIPTILQQSDYASSVAQMVAKYPDVPVFLRFGAEMNIWDNRADPAQFQQAFRMVADIFHSQAPNAAMVWSVNSVSSWDIEMNDYYPGDEYVDWVGVSLYCRKYFLGRNDWSDEEKFNEVVFQSGNSADPVKALDEVIRKYGDRKPIMLAESGASHYTNTLGEDSTAWAVTYLKKIYEYIPRVYPQVKAIFYFDKTIPSESFDYALSSNSTLAAEYTTLVDGPAFIQNQASAEPQTVYAPVKAGSTFQATTVPVSAYVHVFGDDTPKVDYYVDGQWCGSTSAIPFVCNIDFSKYGSGAHTLSVTAESGGRVVASAEYAITVEDNPISVKLNGKDIAFDQPPVILDGRTLVPLRAIFEALSATVEWDGATGTITSVRGDTTVVMQVGSSSFTVNGEEKQLDVPAQIVGGRTMVPARAVAESFDLQVGWDAATRTVTIDQ